MPLHSKSFALLSKQNGYTLNTNSKGNILVEYAKRRHNLKFWNEVMYEGIARNLKGPHLTFSQDF